MSPARTSHTAAARPAETPWRLFVALALPDAVREHVAATQQALRAADPTLQHSIRWVRPELTHLTLHFQGNTAPAAVDTLGAAIETTLAHSAALPLTVADCGVFPHIARPRVLWLGVNGPADTLQRLTTLAESIQHACASQPDHATFRPHITLGRLRPHPGQRPPTALQFALQALPPRSTPWHANRVELVRSVLGAGGPTYTTIASWQLPAAHPGSFEHG